MVAPPARPLDEALAALSAGERGFVLGAMLLGAWPALLETLVDDQAARCRSAFGAWKAQSTEARAATVARLRNDARAATPAGLADVHPDWLRQALLPESSLILRAAVAGLPAAVVDVATAILKERGDDPAVQSPESPAFDEPTRLAIQRAIFVDLVSVARELPSSADLLRSLSARGAETLGVSLRGAPRSVIARAAAQIGAPAAQRLLDAAAQAGSAAERQAARARVAAVRPEDAGVGAAIAVGVYDLAETLAAESSDEAALAVAQRLPLPVGQLLLDAATRARAARTSQPSAVALK